MRRALLVLALVACSQRNRPTEVDAGAAVPARKAMPGVLPKNLSPEALDAFIAYHQVLLDVDKSLGAEPSAADAGTLTDAERRRLEKLANLEDEARRRSRLSDSDLDAWEGLVIEVIAARSGSDPARERELSAKLDRLATKAPGLDLRRGDRPELDQVRARYGDEAVERVLTREAVLRRQLEVPE